MITLPYNIIRFSYLTIWLQCILYTCIVYNMLRDQIFYLFSFLCKYTYITVNYNPVLGPQNKYWTKYIWNIIWTFSRGLPVIIIIVTIRSVTIILLWCVSLCHKNQKNELLLFPININKKYSHVININNYTGS